MSGATSTKGSNDFFLDSKNLNLHLPVPTSLKIAPWNPPNTSRNTSFVPPLQPDDRRNAERRRWKATSESWRVSSPSSRKVYVWRASGRVEALRRGVGVGVGVGGGWHGVATRDPNERSQLIWSWKCHWYQHRSLRPLCFLPMEVLVGKRGGSCKLFGEIFGWLRWDTILGGWQLKDFLLSPRFQVEATGTKSKLGLANLNCCLIHGPETLRVSYLSVFIFCYVRK